VNTLDPARARRANDILDALLEAPAAERDALIDRECGSDEGLRTLVRRLLGHAGDTTSTLHPDRAWRRMLGDVFGADGPIDPLRAGGWRLVRRLGLGGSAEVHLGERVVDGVTQQVAIKFLHADAAGGAMLARFRQEQQILARLSHPAIGKIHDIGLADGGRPYFVMEYVDGAPIDVWCDERRLDLHARLALFVQVADAVAYAHRALVVHRDIKPGNVLIDAAGHPKLVDFGIAKRLDEATADALTEPGGAPVTLGYASPEQLRGDPVGITSDVYQLGMLLYVLAVGLRPTAPRGLGRDEALTLASAVAPLPSERLRRLVLDAGEAADAIAASRRADTRRLLQQVSGDLDRIVARAIAVDADARYPSASHLADDVRNLLAGRPVRARGGGWRYVLGKAMRRHPAAFALGGLLLASLFAFTIIVTRIAFDLDQAHRTAIAQGQLSDRVLEHVISSLRELEPELSGFDGSIVLQALDRAARAPAAQFGTDALTRAQLHLTLARGYETLWAIDEADAQYAAAATLMPSLEGDTRRRLEAQLALGQGRIARVSGRADDAATAFHRALALSEDDPDSRATRATARSGLAALAHARGERDAAITLYRRALADSQAVHGSEHPTPIGLRLNIVLTLLGDEGQSSEADIAQAQSLLVPLAADARRALGDEATLTAMAQLLLGRTHCYRRQFSDCVRVLADELPDASRVLGEQSLQVLKATSELGLARFRLGERDAGLQLLRTASERFDARWNRARRHDARHEFAINLAIAHVLAGSDDDAVGVLEEQQVDRALIAETAELAPLLERLDSGDG